MVDSGVSVKMGFLSMGNKIKTVFFLNINETL